MHLLTTVAGPGFLLFRTFVENPMDTFFKRSVFRDRSLRSASGQVFVTSFISVRIDYV